MPANPATPKYASPQPIDLPDRQWPGRTITRSPQWCSVDLRDGNQALANPLNPDQKLEYFQMLQHIGLKQIEVSFPSASPDDFQVTRRLIEEGRIADDVFVMVLTQCREEFVERTLESVAGAPRAIVHLYCATSRLHIDQVLNMTPAEAMDMIGASIDQVRSFAEGSPQSDIRLEFSPEEFTDSDLPFVLDVCEMVFQRWGRASVDKPVIMNLPATVERRPPNQYADMIEWFCRKFSPRQKISVSLHSHNDQGMAVAATELSLLAGADRVEGTLFGHGERTGNVDLVTLANNFHSRGVETGLDFSDLAGIIETVERLTGMPVHYRQPYSGEYVFTAFSGSHQDAIRKGMHKLPDAPDKFGVQWKVPYLHIDPADLGRQYKQLIRITTQSGKGGVAWVLEQEFGLTPPKAMHKRISDVVQAYSDKTGRELGSDEVYDIFQDEFVNPDGPYELVAYWPRPDENDPAHIHGHLKIRIDGADHEVTTEGNGPISAFVHGMHELGISGFTIVDYDEQAIGKGAEAKAVAYVPLNFENGSIVYGVGTDTNIDQAAIKAIIAGLNHKAKAEGCQR